jgi:site-specific DNA recombinase
VKGKPRETLKIVRCAVYTRKSTEEGLEQEFNSLDAQREAGEAFVRSQANEGWTLLTERYDDGGYTGGNMDRPGLQRLMEDIEAGKVDLVVCYKVDRLSRSLLDFAKMMAAFERHGVGFVSVTQQFNTATSMGRLVLNVLLSFAQFERELVGERTRDKIAATRRKGKWAGGRPILGYDVDPRGYKLVVNEHEATRVRQIFEQYQEHEALMPVVEELRRRGWVNKCWQTRKERPAGGAPFDRSGLYRLLTNVAYIGRVKYKDEVHDGEHAAIVDDTVFQRVQAILRRNGGTRGAPVRNQFGALLRGLIRCGPCGCAMTPSHTTRKKRKRYRYYVCTAAQKNGWHACPSKSVPAGQIEEFVLDQIKCIGRDRALFDEVLAQARQQDAARTAEMEAERQALERDLGRWHGELRKLTTQMRPGDPDEGLIRRLSDLQGRIGTIEARVRKVREQIETVHGAAIDEDEAAQALAVFDPVWESLTPHEQARVVGLLVKGVEYDGGSGKVSVTFRAAGIKTLAEQLESQREECIA